MSIRRRWTFVLLVIVVASTFLLGRAVRLAWERRAPAATLTVSPRALQSPVVPFPCSEATAESDPNNCGFCGTICGTYGLNSQGTERGVSFQQGTCSNGICAPYTVQSTSTIDAGIILLDGGLLDGAPQDGGYIVVDGGVRLALDCLSLQNGSVYALLRTNPTCVSVLTDVNNCGGLGILCNGTCQNAQCAGIRTVPTPITVSVSTPTHPTDAQTIRASGGSPPYYFAFAPLGNQSGGTLNGTTGHYVAGATTGGADVVQAFDSVGNQGSNTIANRP